MTSEEILKELHALWPRLRMRSPSTAEELESKRAIHVELEERYGPTLRPEYFAQKDAEHEEQQQDVPPRARHARALPERTTNGLEIVYNPRLVHGIALKRHAHPWAGGFPFDQDEYDHIHGPISHGFKD